MRYKQYQPLSQESYPAVESDPGISEPWFLEWCDKSGKAWEMTSSHLGDCVWLDVANDDSRVVNMFDGNFRLKQHVRVSGETPSEARAKAVIAASVKVKP